MKTVFSRLLIFFIITCSIHVFANSHIQKRGINGQRRKCISQKTKNCNDRCVLPEHPKFGKWSLIRDFQPTPGLIVMVNTVLQFGCDDGYQISNDSSFVVCQTYGWSTNVFPICLKKCPPPKITEEVTFRCFKGGKEIKCTEATHGTIAEIICPLYYESSDLTRVNRYCYEGHWNLPPPVCQPICGKSIDNSLALIKEGRIEEGTNLPWGAAIHTTFGNTATICGGTILTKKIIVTAARCVTDFSGNHIDEDNILVGVGKNHIKKRNPDDSDSKYLKVSELVIHEDYKGVIRNYVSDIAVLVTKTDIPFSKYALPVCFRDYSDMQVNEESYGLVPKLSETSSNSAISNDMQIVEAVFKQDSVCYQELLEDFVDLKYFTHDKICSGYRNNSLRCSRINGWGLVFKNPVNNRFYIHGIASISHIQLGTICDEKFTLYTHVIKYYNWLEKIISQHS